MFFILLGLVLMGFSSGLLLLHWLGLGLVSLVMSVVYLVLTRWDLLLVPKWLSVLVIFQVAHLAGATLRVRWDDIAEERS